MRFLLSLILISVCLSCTQDEPQGHSGSEALFEKVPSTHSRLTFSNTLTEDLSTRFNLLDFDYFYNGAGVAVGDINNDGLEDIFLTGNMVPNKLYLNKGNLEFEDISSESGINQSKQWSNGVTFADINSDGWLDIYVSQGGPHPKDKRANLLFINNQNLSFTESAQNYGIDDSGISTQSAFVDYDLDGDLDCIVMNESILYGFDPISFLQRIATSKEDKLMSLSRLYQNQNGKYTDVSISAGINKPSFGLGLLVSDFNDDQLPDFYIANDYYLPDNMYINQGDGTFKDEIKQRTKHLSMFGMGADAADINNDLKQDFFVLDMAADDHYRSKTLMASMDTRQFDLLVKDLRFHHQYMFNSFQINDGMDNYKNLSHLTGLAKTDWSWSVLMADFDLDGNKDVFVTNGYRRYGLDNDFKQKVNDAKSKYNGNVPIAIKKELYNSMPEGKLPNLMYQNMGQLDFKDVSDKWGLVDSTFSNGAAYSDLDNDGDLDLIINNIDQEVLLYKNTANSNYLKVKIDAKNLNEFVKLNIFCNGQAQSADSKTVRGYRSSVTNIIHFGLGKNNTVDSLIAFWQNGEQQLIKNIEANKLISITKKEVKLSPDNSSEIDNIFATVSNSRYGLNYVHRENDYDDFNKEILLPIRQSTLGPILSAGDINNDGKNNVFIGGAAGIPSVIYEQSGTKFRQKNSTALLADDKYEDMGALFFDYDKDGDQDLFVSSGGNAFESNSENYINRLYQNDGLGNLNKLDIPVFNADKSNTKKAVHADLNGDGYDELIIANRIIPQHYPNAAPSIIYDFSSGEAKDVTTSICPTLQSFGIINDIITTDIDTDGDVDLIAVGEWTGIGIFENIEGQLKDISAGFELNELKGWWNAVATTDIDKDGDPDYIIGNLGLNSKYSASDEKPFKIFAHDFDNNGTHDIVLSNQYKGRDVPLRGKECSSQQMPFISEKFKSYDAFASASLIDIYGDDLESSYKKEVNTFKSYLLLNTNDGLQPIPLPMQAQEFPILAIQVLDVNKDGFEDLILAGNIYQTEVETPRLDSGNGVILLNNKKGFYEYLPNFKSGLNIPGDVKSLIQLKVGNKDLLLAGKNQDLLQIIELSND